MSDINYDGMYSPKGGAYRKPLPLPPPDPPPKYDAKGKKKKSKLPRGNYSYYTLPIAHSPGRAAGNSRRHGDASHDVQKKSIDAIIEAAKKHGLTQRETAHVLAIGRVESGFNPDAAAGTTTASGLGQFVRATGWWYGINDTNRFELKSNADALVRHYTENRDIAKKRGFTGKELEYKIYQYHHDGVGSKTNPAKDYGGLSISINKVIPLTDKYEKLLKGISFEKKAINLIKPTNNKPIIIKRVSSPEVDSLYVVKPGDTLCKISKLYGASIAKIILKNPTITDINVIHVGQKLIIPNREKAYVSSYHRTRNSKARKPKIGVVDKQPWWGETLYNRLIKKWF